MESMLLTALIAAICLANLFVSLAVLRSEVLEPEQKIAQLALVWLLPVVGAILAWLVLRDDRQPRRGENPHADRHDPGDWDYPLPRFRRSSRRDDDADETPGSGGSADGGD